MLQNLLIATRNLLQHKRRTFLLGGAIAGVTALLVVMLGLFGGIQDTLLESATTVMTGHVNVGGFFKVTAGASSPVVTRYKDVEKVIRQTVPEVDYIAARGRGWAKLVSETGAMQSGIAGIEIAREPGLKRVLKITSGKLDDLSEPNTLVIFEQQAKKLNVKVGDAITISAPTMRGVNNTADVHIVAIAQDLGLLSGWTTFIPERTLRDLYQQNDDTTGFLLVYLKDMRDVDKVSERLRKSLADAGFPLLDKDPRAFWFKFDSVNREAWTGQKLDVTSWQDEVSFIQWTMLAIQALGNTLLFILLIVIAVGVMNTLWIAIRERTREIGTLRSIGMQRGRVIMMFLTESFVLSVAATFAGAVLGLLACAVINANHVAVPLSVQLFLMSDQLHLAIRPFASLIGMAVIVTCTTGVSLIPSFLAARLKPVTAMSQVG
jgi:ABC-type lipoprotein release transport system permease subunit